MRRFLPWLVMGASAAMAVSAEGCADRACLEWSTQAQGACPSRADALEFFGRCSDIKHVDSEPSYISDQGGLCCYDVTHYSPRDKFIDCPPTTTPTTTTTTSGTGGSTPTTPVGTGGTTSTGGGGSPSCQTCSDALVAGNSGDLCPGPASDAFVALVSCACSADVCASACHAFCSLGSAPTSTCSSCFDAACSAEAAACGSE